MRGLGGVIGSSYVRATNQLFFVKFDGKVSVLDLTPGVEATVFTGVAPMPADTSLTWSPVSGHGGHIWWDHTSPVFLQPPQLPLRQGAGLTSGANPLVRWVSCRVRPRYRVIGTGYSQPEDIVVGADGRHAYVTERPGNLSGWTCSTPTACRPRSWLQG